MRPAPFDFCRAKSVADAFATYAETDGEAKYLAGGQSLGPMLNLRLSQPDRLIDISGLAELRAVTEGGDEIVLGSAIRHAEIEDRKVPDASGGLMPRAARNIAYRAVRNRGTVGGSLAHADPVADWPNILSALDARVVAVGPDGKREIALPDFFLGPLTTSLLPEEILLAVRIPKLASDARSGIGKFSRKAGEFAHALSIVVRRPGGGSRVVMGCIGATPLVLGAVGSLVDDMASLSGDPGEELSAALNADLSKAGIVPDPLEFRMHRATLLRAVRECYS